MGRGTSDLNIWAQPGLCLNPETSSTLLSALQRGLGPFVQWLGHQALGIH